MGLVKDIQKNKENNFQRAQELFDQGRYKNALGYYFRTLNAVALVDDPEMEVKAKKGILFSYANIGEYDLALEYCDDLIQNYEHLGSEHKELTLVTKAYANTVKGHYTCAREILEGLVNSESRRVRYRAHMDLGLLYYRMNVFSEESVLDLALKHLKQAYQYKDVEGQTSEFKCELNLGILYVNVGDFDQALECFYAAIEATDKEYFKMQSYVELAKVYAYQGDLEKTEEFFDKSYRYAMENKRYLHLAFNVYYRGLVQKHQGKVNNAYSYLHTALYSFLEFKRYPEVVAIYKELHDLFKETHPERAEYFLNEYYHFLNYIDPIGE